MKTWINRIEEQLTGGHHNSLSNTVEVAEAVLADPSQKLMNDLCECYKSEDDVVRMRVSSALKRISGLHSESISTSHKPRPEWIMKRFDWLIDDIGRNLDQPSAKWSIAQIMMHLDDQLSDEQRNRVIDLLKYNLETEQDWIVKCTTAEALTEIVIKYSDKSLLRWLVLHLEGMTKDSRKSVSGRGKKLLVKLHKENE